jgi:hypothetical protein
MPRAWCIYDTVQNSSGHAVQSTQHGVLQQSSCVPPGNAVCLLTAATAAAAAAVLQDIVTRYACATGHHCTRRFGWDCHGLPVEYEIDKKLGACLGGGFAGGGGTPCYYVGGWRGGVPAGWLKVMAEGEGMEGAGGGGG